MRLRLTACVSLGVAAFAACGNDYSEDSKTNPDGGTSFDGGASSSGTSGKPGVDGGGGPFGEEENLPCDGRTADDKFSLYVASSGTDNATCGTREAPCKTIQTGFANALVAQKPKVLVGAGTYVEALTLDGGLTIEGGWDVSGSTWTANCSAGHSSIATIQAPDSANTTIKATRGATVLRFLTIKSKDAAAPGESHYGLVALGPNVKVALDDTSFLIAGGGKGADGAKATGNVSPDCGGDSNGAPGTPGDVGPAGPIGSLSSTTFTPSSGGDGLAGANGHQGTAAPVPNNFNYSRCESSGPNACAAAAQFLVPNLGTSGCGGGGGLGGKAGGGGGSSIGILATDALIVTYGGSVTTGPGGVGGNGGEGADGADGTIGKQGLSATYLKAPSGSCGPAPDCGNTLDLAPGGPPGGNGGNGGKGGQGSGGAGGWSISFAKFGTAALLASTTTVFTTAVGGKGGTPNGVEGLRQQQWP